MDPLSALSLACNIIDLVSKAVKGVNIMVDIYRKGLDTANETISHEADGLRDIIKDLRGCQSQPDFNTADRKMQDVSRNLISQCDELQTVLDGCRSSQTRKLLSAFKASAKLVLNYGKIEQLQNDIKSSRDELFRWVATNTHTGVHDALRQLETITQTNFQMKAILEDVNAQIQLLGVTDSLTENGVTAGMEEIKQVVIDRVILQLLDFPGLGSRFDDVVTQEEGTFEWIFTDPETIFRSHPHLRTTFPEWLESGDGIFHVCGKPGSGKSTLMKYICRNPTTEELLNKWSGDDELLIAKFFFWRAGAQEQKSMRGLIRGLLHQILCRVPKLSRDIFPQKTRKRLINGFRRDSSAGLDSDEIIAAFSRLADISVSSSLRHLRICLFIDGLDEFDDIHINQSPRELVGKLCLWAKNSDGHVKICVSSRIQEPFIDMLDASKRLTLHKLTTADIELFITQMLGRHSKFQMQQQKNPTDCQNLIYDIRRSAEGVFLWVALVLKDIEAGLDNGIPIKRLQDIVSEKPRDLDTLLEQIMNSILETSRRGVKTLLSAMLRATGMLLSPKDEFPGYSHLREILRSTQGLDISALSAFFILRAIDIGVSLQEDFAIDKFDFEKEEWFHDHMTDSEISETIGSIVRTQCKGLIDIVDDGFNHKTVKFMHRSVPEFLRTYFSHASPSNSDHFSTVVMSWAVLVEVKWTKAGSSFSSFLHSKSRSQQIEDDDYDTEWIEKCFLALVQLLRQMKLGDEWEDLFRILVSIDQTWREFDGWNIFLLCARVGLHECIEWAFRNTDILADKHYRALVTHEVIPNIVSGRGFQNHLAFMETAFAHGLDWCDVFWSGSNGLFNGQPLWHIVLLRMQSAFDAKTEHDYDTKARWATVIELWLRHGANPRVRFRLSEDGREGIGISDASDDLGSFRPNHPHRTFYVPSGLQGKGKKEISLYDIVLHWKPPNEATLLDLLKSDIEDDSHGTQEPSQIEPDSPNIDNNHRENTPAIREHPELKSPSNEECSVPQPNQWLRGWIMHILTRQYLLLVIVGMLGFIIAHFVFSWFNIVLEK
ncbi:hypothetical protein F4680DRAFT_66370 [Xylaria scruposa]|nr:hypothetical protein F4680DRAFT_66370 [Xylaria scruposa]